jgi:ParB family chromosome partitioning protein
MKLDRIFVGERLRPVNPARVQMLMETPEALEQPILVRPANGPNGADHRLVFGAHRLDAAKRLGWTEIEVKVKPLDDNEAVIAEVDENLNREDLSPLDRAIFLAARKRAYEALHPEAKQGGDRRSTKRQEDFKRQTLPIGFSRAAAEAVGLSERTIRDAVQLAESLGPTLIRRLQGTPIAGNASDLKALAKLDEKVRSRVVDQIEDGKAARLPEALKQAGLARPAVDTDEQVFRALVGLWTRAPAKVRKRFLAHAGLQATKTGKG